MALLEAMLRDDVEDPGSSPTAAALEALADSAWGPLIVGAAGHLPLGQNASLRYSATQGAGADPLWEALRVLRPEDDLPEPAGAADAAASPAGSARSGSVFAIPHLALAVQLTGISTTGMALVLDDSDEALASPEHPEAWLA